MNRRAFLGALALASAVPHAAWAQRATTKIPRIGILHIRSSPDPWLDGFRLGLSELGYMEGQNLAIEYRWAEGRRERLPELAADLVRLKVDAIVCVSGFSVRAAKAVTNTIPIIMAVSGDPLMLGFVGSLARPGGNVTGLSFMSTDLAAKRLEMLKAAVPKATRVGVLFNPNEPPTGPELRETAGAAQTLGITLQPLEVRDAGELEGALTRATREGCDGLITFVHDFALQHRHQIVDLAARHRLPGMYGWREFVEVGGLISYGPYVTELLRRAAYMVDKVLKGVKPGDLPIEQPTKFELLVNLRAAKALGVTIPPSVLLRADQVIQ